MSQASCRIDSEAAWLQVDSEAVCLLAALSRLLLEWTQRQLGYLFQTSCIVDSEAAKDSEAVKDSEAA